MLSWRNRLVNFLPRDFSVAGDLLLGTMPAMLAQLGTSVYTHLRCAPRPAYAPIAIYPHFSSTDSLGLGLGKKKQLTISVDLQRFKGGLNFLFFFFLRFLHRLVRFNFLGTGNLSSHFVSR